MKKQNDALQKAFSIQAFPTLMLCDSDGRPYSEAGFPDEMTPKGMQATLDKARKVKAERDALFAKAAEAEGTAKAELLVKALGVVPQAAVPSAYSKTVDQIAKLDPEDKSGFVKKVRTQQALANLESGFGDLMEAEKIDEAVKYIDDFIAEHKPEGESKQKALLFKVFGLASKENYDDAIKVADEIIKIDGRTQTAAMVSQIKRQLQNQ